MKDRMRLLTEQPPLVKNFTKSGFMKSKAPPILMAALLDYFLTNRASYSREVRPGL